MALPGKQNSPVLIDYLVVFFISLFVISLELFLTRILSLKTWNHIVYLIIPFAVLGYGIGANIYLIFRKSIGKFNKSTVISFCLILISITSILSTLHLIGLEVHLKKLLHSLSDFDSIVMLIVSYFTVLIPFIPFGFLIVYLFSENVPISNKLYFFDLLGAGAGALVFILLINHFAVVSSIVILSLITLFLLTLIKYPNKKFITTIIFSFLIILSITKIDEPSHYAIDQSKGWENIPDLLSPHQYDLLVSEWNSLGRTDIYRIKDASIRKQFLKNAYFRINLSPPPEFSYITTNITAGTPIFHFSEDGIKKSHSMVDLFSQPFEAPYTVLKHPTVAIIGTGGGRDIFTALTHNAKKITGAEINPTTYAHMSPGGKLFNYSGGIYNANNVQIYNVDGRHLIKTLNKNTYDLIVLTGVDTFSGLVNGAYTYAESYLYTKTAVENYLDILMDNGILNFNRRFFPDKPREGLRLFVISLEALRSSGATHPWDHIIIGGFQKWSIILVKKTPFTTSEKATIMNYFKNQGTQTLFPNEGWKTGRMENLTAFDHYAKAFFEGKQKQYEKTYPYDISVITDDNPFFYKYYKFNILNPFSVEYDRHTGTLIFITQMVVLGQALFFILLFIFIPLMKFKAKEIKNLPKNALFPFITYFSCLGVGFMFIEIPLMQKFVLLLGSPIYSISVTLTALLIFTGLGSLLAHYLKDAITIKLATFLLCMCLIFFIGLNTLILEHAVQFSFFLRIMTVCGMLLPLGLCLGIFFPRGLKLVGKNYQETVAWAWGLNSGFTVLGSILAIVIAQFSGFHFVLWLALGLYCTASYSYYKLKKNIEQEK